MKEKTKPKLKPLILTIFLLILTGFSFAGTANRNTSPGFTTNSIATISLIHKPQLTHHNSQLALAIGVGGRKSTKSLWTMRVNGTLPAHEHPLLFFNLTLNTYHLTLRPPAGNLYQYGLSNPLLNTDPEGEKIISLEPQGIEDSFYLEYTENPNLLTNRIGGMENYDIISFSDAKSGDFAYYAVWHAKSKRYVYLLENEKDLTTFQEERGAYLNSKVIRKIEYLQQMTERVLRSKPYEQEATRYMESMLAGNLGDAARHFGRSWLNAVKDWHWWRDAAISTALAYVSIVAENQLTARMATRERVGSGIRATRSARAARMRVATTVETDAPVMKLTAQGRSAAFYVKPDGTIIPSTGYRALGGEGVEWALDGDIMSKSGPTYFTFNDLGPYSGREAQEYLQMTPKHIPSHYAEFDTLQIIDDISIPAGHWNKWRTDSFVIPEPLTRTFPKFGKGGFTQAITNTPIQKYYLRRFWK